MQNEGKQPLHLVRRPGLEEEDEDRLFVGGQLISLPKKNKKFLNLGVYDFVSLGIYAVVTLRVWSTVSLEDWAAVCLGV